MEAPNKENNTPLSKSTFYPHDKSFPFSGGERSFSEVLSGRLFCHYTLKLSSINFQYRPRNETG
jgi:hypothetical protein